MAGINFNKAQFVKSAAESRQFIKSSQPQVVFAGKSNVGKSSVINRVLNRKNFARVGDTPGKTIHINYFLIDDRLYIIDLPGYGYAKVGASERERWSNLMESFFTSSLFDLGVLIVDSRHLPTKDDIVMCDYFKNSGKPFVLLANKIDKLKNSEIDQNLKQIEDVLGVKPIAFSAEKGNGRDVLVAQINNLC